MALCDPFVPPNVKITFINATCSKGKIQLRVNESGNFVACAFEDKDDGKCQKCVFKISGVPI